MKDVLLAFALVVISMSVSANQWSERVKVTEIIAGYKEGFIFFRTTGQYHNPNNCENMYSLDPESANVETAFAILLAAQRSGSEIQVGIDPEACGRSGVNHLAGKIKATRVRSF